MRRLLVPAVVAVALSAVSLAFAAEMSSGTIKSISSKQHSITLTNGQIYYLPKTYKLSALKVGEKVAITWEAKNGKNMASEVKTS